MEDLQSIGSLFASFWQLFTDIEVPLLGISFASLWLGVFVVGISIAILRPLLGIGAGAVNNISRGLKSSSRRRSNRNREESNE